MKLVPAILFTLTLLLFASYGQIKNENNTSKRIENYLSELEKVGFYGSVLVELDGEVIISKRLWFQ